MWRYLIVVALIVCLAGLIGCSGGSGLNLGGSNNPEPGPGVTNTIIPAPVPSPGPGSPPGSPF